MNKQLLKKLATMEKTKASNDDLIELNKLGISMQEAVGMLIAIANETIVGYKHPAVKTEVSAESIAELEEYGYNVTDIAKHFGVSRQTIYNRKKYGDAYLIG